MIIFEERPSDSAFAERIWRSTSEYAGSFISMATSHWGLVVTKHEGRIYVTVRGPESKATTAFCPAEGEWVGIRFKLGTFMPYLPAKNLVDAAADLPGALSKSFYLNGSSWEFPTYENADTFVERLVREGLLMREPVVDETLSGQLTDLSLRSAQRRFLQATGLTHATIRQIERARYATALLREGVSILDTVYQAGYFDQPHLARSLKRFTGLSPTQLKNQNQQLSLLYKTAPPQLDYDEDVQFIEEWPTNGQNNRVGISVAGRRDGIAGELALPLSQR